MKRLSLGSTVILLALSYLGPAILSDVSDLGTAQAQDDDRKDKDERRVLKLSDMGQEDVSEAYRAMARQKRHESMDFLKDILANRAPAGEQKAEMMLRLADLYFEEGRDLYLSEMKVFEDAFDKCFNTPGCKTDSVKQATYVVESRKWQDRSIKLYQQILSSYPQYRRADEATFFLASAQQDIGEKEEAVKNFLNLVKTYPESGYTPDAYVQIGEYYFDNNNAYKALMAYQKAARYKDSPKYSFAMYKLAWCYYNVGEYGKAIDTMKAVVAFAMTPQDGESNAQSRMSLQDEALKDLVRFFADAGNIDEAYAYFNKLGKKELIRSMLKRLASTYFEQGKFEECINTYRRLIAEDPTSPDAPGYQNEIIGAYSKMGRKQETLAEIDRLLKQYGNGSSWARANSANQDAVKEAQDFLEKNLRTVAFDYHNEAKKLGTGSQARETYDLAYQAYSVYLREFPESKYSYDVRYSYGELLYKLKKYDEAYVQYMKVVSLDPKGKHSMFCAESAIFAADEMIKVAQKAGNDTSPAKGSTEAMDLSEWEKKMLDACDQYSKTYPDDAKTRNIIYKSAYLLYNHNQFKEASDRFRVVIGMNPKSKEAEQAANLILDSFTLVEDWKNLKDVSKAFYDQDGLGSSSFKKEVYNIYERASFKLIEKTFEKSKDEGSAANAYMAFYAEFPQSEVADLALNNASVYFHNTNNVAKSMEARQKLIENFPKSKFYNDQVAALGFDYESIADFSEAATWYEKLFTLDPANPGSADALYSAALFRKASGQWEASIENYQKFIKAYPTDERTQGLNITVARVYEDNEKWAEAAAIYNTYFTRPPETASLDEVMFSRLHYGLCLEKQDQKAKADKHYKESVAVYQKAIEAGGERGPATEFTAQMMLTLAQPQLSQYLDMTISGPSGKASRAQTDKTLTKQLVDKAKTLQGVEVTFADIVKTGAGEWGLAALVDLGKAYENMGDSLTKSYIPDYLNEDQREMYTMGLQDKQYLQVEKATNVYAQALTKAYELNLYNDNTAYATRRLAELRPDEFPELSEDILEARYTSGQKSDREIEKTP